MFFFIYMISLRTKYAFKQDENRVNIFSWICVVRHHIFWYILRKKVYFQWCLVIFLFFLSVRILMWWSSFKRNNRTFMLLPMELVWGSQYLFPQTLKLMNNCSSYPFFPQNFVPLYTVSILSLYRLYCLPILLLNTKKRFLHTFTNLLYLLWC